MAIRPRGEEETEVTGMREYLRLPYSVRPSDFQKLGGKNASMNDAVKTKDRDGYVVQTCTAITPSRGAVMTARARIRAESAAEA